MELCGNDAMGLNLLSDFYDNSYAPKAQNFCIKAIKLSHLPIQIFPPSAKLYSLYISAHLSSFSSIDKNPKLHVRVIGLHWINSLTYTNCIAFISIFGLCFVVLSQTAKTATKSKRSKNSVVVVVFFRGESGKFWLSQQGWNDILWERILSNAMPKIAYNAHKERLLLTKILQNV